MSYIVISIDPGSISIGYSVLFDDGNCIVLLKSGYVRFDRQDRIPFRLYFFLNFLLSLYDDFHALYLGSTFCVAVERPFVYKNVSSAFLIHSFYTVVLLFSEKISARLFAFSPCEIKRFVSGSGKASKLEIQESLRALLSDLGATKMCVDESDAIAIGLFAISINRAPHLQNFKKS